MAVIPEVISGNLPTISIRTSALQLPSQIPIAAIVDGDGTTIEHGGKIPQTVRLGLIEVRKAGGITVLATGRTPWTITEKEKRAFKTDLAVISENGARTRVGGLVEMHHALAPDEIREIVAGIGFQRGNILYAIAFPQNPDEQPIRWVLDEAHMEAAAGGSRRYASVFTGGQQQIERLWLEQKPGLILVRPRKGLDIHLEFSDDINAVGTDNGSREITAAGISKRKAAEELLSLLDISPQVVLAMGNGLNDDHLEIEDVSRILVGTNEEVMARFGHLPNLEKAQTVQQAGQILQTHALIQ